MSLRRSIVSALLGAYKCAVSPLLHSVSGTTGACRFQPTCSEYAAIAVCEQGFGRGGWMTLKRLLRCHPLCRGGFDPVPVRRSRPVASSRTGYCAARAHTQLP